MPLRARSCLTAIAVSWCLAASASAQALPLPARLPVRSGGHAATARVELEEGGTRIRLESGSDRPEVRLPWPTTEATALTLEATSGPVVVVRAEQPGGVRLAAVFAWARGHARLVWSGRLDLHGDAGERTADALETEDRTGDGRPDVVVGSIREGVGRCGELALLAPRALTAGGELRAVELRRGLPDSVPLRSAVIESPGPTGEPLLRALRFAGATSTAGEADPLLASPPRALTDGDPATVWAEGRPGDGAGELVVGRWESDTPIRALRLRSGPGIGLPRALSLVLGAHEERLTLPEGTDVWVVLETPVAASCVALVIDQGAPAGPTGFGEVSAYTDPDFGRGIDALVDELVAEGPRGDDVATWLGRLGEPACVALDAAWERLGLLGHLRAVRVAGAVRTEIGTALLSRGAADEAAEVREEALRLLVARGAFDALAARAIVAGEPGDDAARALARAEEARPSDASVVLGALAEGADRPALRTGAARVAANDPGALESFLASAPPRALAALAVGLTDDLLGARDRDARNALALRVIQAAAPGAREFVDRYRLAVAARELSTDALDAWLGEQATAAEEWMQRDAALEALGVRASADVLAHALADAYPRVRMRAVALAGARDERAALTAALADPWPTVRLAAVVALAEPASARAALDDDVALVRVGAIEVLTNLGDGGARELVEARLTDRDEWPEVLRAALSYVETLCLVESGPAVAQVVRRGAREDAWAPDVELALDALAVALRLGGEAAELGEAAARSGGASIAAFEPVLARREAFTPCR